MSSLLVRNGRVVDPAQGIDGEFDVLIEDGVIAAVDRRIEADAPVLDAGGLVVAPGFIDLHTHLREPGFEYKETIETGCRAAAAGGFTAVCCMANTDPVNDEPAVTRYIMEKATRAGAVRVHPIGALSKGCRGEELAEIGEMVAGGAISVSDSPNPMSNTMFMRQALEYCRSFDIPAISHPQDVILTDRGTMHEGRVSTRIGLRGMPAPAEEIIVVRDLALAEFTGGRLHLGHLSTAGSVEAVRRAKARGAVVTCEVTAHHFSLIDEDVAVSNYDPRWKMNPPLRSDVDRRAVLEGLSDGTIDAIVSDHAPHHQDETEMDFADAPFGISGLETAVSLALDRLVTSEIIGIGDLVRLMSASPAAIVGVPGGSLAQGSPGDLTILDLDREVTVEPSNFVSRGRNTPFGGMTLRGAPSATIVAGRIVWRAGEPR